MANQIVKITEQNKRDGEYVGMWRIKLPYGPYIARDTRTQALLELAQWKRARMIKRINKTIERINMCEEHIEAYLRSIKTYN